MIGGSLAGVFGALLALPVAALVKVVVNDHVIAKRVDEVRTTSLNGGRGMSRRRPTDVRPLPLRVVNQSPLGKGSRAVVSLRVCLARHSWANARDRP